MIFAYLFIAVAAVLNTAQSGCNGTLHKQIQHPFLPGIIVYSTGLIALLVASVLYGWVSGTPAPGWEQWKNLAATGPWWMWAGGALGAIYVLAMVNVATRTGAALFMGISVSASILTSLVLDNYAFLGFTHHTTTAPRMIGAGLMMIGLILIATF